MKTKIAFRKKYLSLIITILGILVGLIYNTLNHFGIIDKWSKIDKLDIALNRLYSANGYPVSFLTDSIDCDIFRETYNLIKNQTADQQTNLILSELYIPKSIASAGDPISILGIPENWDVAKKRIYTNKHPIIFIFHEHLDGEELTKSTNPCTIGDLEQWINKKRSNRDYLINGVLLSVILIFLAVGQAKISTN